ncbi:MULTISPECIES: aldolase/citrate lyase family protein [unclassified Mesorhizobium]|uniref:HpcH/HpaI aldolase family protein n=1 Tax=unclassified Mesorhizobium TaxID=325217 RepID=UPI000FC9BBDD|nr:MULTISPECIES: aldolase/citrate lyase family protein [unclassified Mesorhizobium]RUW32858.1 4-hydroxy-2-oxovalerate aldolase [Mesorhizobium sp. M1E.F.Ca.ET.041.01.1.1]RWD84918.1 MAG: 4-hydroxy-2-oxovalerate aldolase [Mesorhizobium sp.]RWD90043.1 MAG: 4-hydroxy-2-oxovalerate aldolase [Mesorhizobium sp.]TIV54162.1 MAG: 4-hydroxy-2-oxovalerate aldolase [Mesorhizobium sp.]
MDQAGSFRSRLRSGTPLVGTWIKTPSRIVTEVLACSALDVLCLDAEHAPFDRGDLDGSIFASSALGMPVLVRPAATSAESLLNCLDLGAIGIVAPHIRNGEEADRLVQSSLFGPGGRGYAGSTRAAGFTRKSMAEHRQRSTEDTVIIAQIEDREALDRLSDIIRIERLDCLFIGRVDLTISMGAASPRDPQVVEAVEEICRKAGEAGMRTGMFVSDLAELPGWLAMGSSLFLLSSDQTFLQEGASSLRSAFDASAFQGATTISGGPKS